MELFTFSHYYATLLEPQLRLVRQDRIYPEKHTSPGPFRLSPWKRALLAADLSDNSDVIDTSSSSSSVESTPRHYRRVKTSHHQVGIVGYCLGLLDRYALVGQQQRGITSWPGSERVCGGECCPDCRREFATFDGAHGNHGNYCNHGWEEEDGVGIWQEDEEEDLSLFDTLDISSLPIETPEGLSLCVRV
eukprot:sb/3471154/